ncbi:MAG: WG repeat-containing protein [Candidatus Fermentibacteria bacterium]
MHRILGVTLLICAAGCNTDIADANGLLFPVKEDGDWGFINQQGEYVIDPQFDGASGFSENLAPVRLNGQYGYINRTGEIMIDCQFERVGDFSEGLSAVLVGDKWGFINRAGELIIRPQYDYLYESEEWN